MMKYQTIQTVMYLGHFKYTTAVVMSMNEQQYK